MTLDVHMFIKEKGGDPDAIRESEKKRYRNVAVVDEVIALYEQWVKGWSTKVFQRCHHIYGLKCHRLVSLMHSILAAIGGWWIEYFQLGEINKKINSVQKEITAKKKVGLCYHSLCRLCVNIHINHGTDDVFVCRRRRTRMNSWRKS